jgi:Lhr-like helicase
MPGEGKDARHVRLPGSGPGRAFQGFRAAANVCTPVGTGRDESMYHIWAWTFSLSNLDDTFAKRYSSGTTYALSLKWWDVVRLHAQSRVYVRSIA